MNGDQLRWDDLSEEQYEEALEKPGLEEQEIRLMHHCQDHMDGAVKVACTYLFDLLVEVAELRVWTEVTGARK